ncbi:MAG: hypothetical protein Q8N52_03600 [Acidobacteriota bacterium]|nr:hypothetical protein [Acidobacteriota bacterium]
MTIGQFLLLSWQDAEARLRSVTAPDTADPVELWDELDRSLPGRVIGAVDRVLTRATPESRARAAWRAVSLPLVLLDPVRRMGAVGVVALTAAVTHVALVATTAPVGGWWLILPGIVGLFGVTAITLSFLGPPTKVRD